MKWTGNFDKDAMIATQALALQEQEEVNKKVTMKLVHLSTSLKALLRVIEEDEEVDESEVSLEEFRTEVAMQLRSIVDTELFDVIGDDEADEDDDEASESDGDDASDASAGALSQVALSVSQLSDDHHVKDVDDQGDELLNGLLSDDDASPPESSPTLIPGTVAIEVPLPMIPAPLDYRGVPEKFSCDKLRISVDVNGGVYLADDQAVHKLRGMAKDILKDIGRRIMFGKFDLQTLVLPIDLFVPRSIPQHIAEMNMYLPIYCRLAAKEKDALQRFKLVVTGAIASWHRLLCFKKPFQPNTGETFCQDLGDGVTFYSECTWENPVCLMWEVVDTKSNYECHGFLRMSGTPGLNNVNLRYEGQHTVSFTDSEACQTIAVSCPMDQFEGIMYGEKMRRGMVGKVHCEDSMGVTCDILVGGSSEHPSDYLEGVFRDARGVSLADVSGTYLVYIDIDGQRFWDIRLVPCLPGLPREDTCHSEALPSDSSCRPEIIHLIAGKNSEAQEVKVALEAENRALVKRRKGQDYS
jgi:hypothetical protein